MCATKCEPHRRRPDQGCQFGCALSDCSLASWPSLSSPHRETGVCVASAADTVLCWRRILQLRSPVPRQMRSVHEPVDVGKNININVQIHVDRRSSSTYNWLAWLGFFVHLLATCASCEHRLNHLVCFRTPTHHVYSFAVHTYHISTVPSMYLHYCAVQIMFFHFKPNRIVSHY